MGVSRMNLPHLIFAIAVIQSTTPAAESQLRLKIEPSSNPVPLGEDVTLTCSPTPDVGEFDAIWLQDRELTRPDYGIREGNTLTLTQFRPSHAGVYSCLSGDTTSTELNIRFSMPTPTIKLHTPSPVYLGSSIMFMCNSEARGVDHLWGRDDATVNITSSNVFIASMTPDLTGTYTCSLGTADQVSKPSHGVDVDYAVPQPSIRSEEKAFYIDEKASLQCVSQFDDKEYPRQFTWLRDGLVLQTIAGNALSMARTSPEHGSGKLPVIDNFLYFPNFFDELSGAYTCIETIGGVRSEVSPVFQVTTAVPAPTVLLINHTDPSSPAPLLGSEIVLECRSPLPNVTYSWRNNTVVMKHTASEIRTVLAPYQAGTYECSVSLPNIGRNSSWSRVELTFRVPRPTIQTDSQTVLLGDRLLLRCISGYQTTYWTYFIWFKNGAQIDGSWGSTFNFSGNTLVVDKFHAELQGAYECMDAIRNTFSEKSLAVIIRFEVPRPRIRASSSIVSPSSEFLLGTNFSLECSVSVVGLESEFILEKDGSVLRDLAPGDLLVMSTDMGGVYTCKASVRGHLSQSSEPLVISFKVPSPELISDKLVASQGENVTLTCASGLQEDNLELEVMWFRNGDILDQWNSSVLEIPRFEFNMSGNYRCLEIINGVLSNASNQVKINFKDAHALCSCPCGNMTLSVALNDTEMEEMVTSIQKNLTVETRGLSATVREKESAPDHRPTSVSAGYMAAIFLALVPSLVIGLDCVTLVKYIITYEHTPRPNEAVAE